MQKLLIIVLLLFAHKGDCQPKFENDTSYYQFSRPTLSEIRRTFGLDTTFDFEFQFWAAHSKTLTTQTFIITLKNKEWKGRFFERIRKGLDTLIERPVNQSGLAQLWKQLHKHKIGSIPKDEDLRDKKGKEISRTIHDGIFYYFSFKTADRKRCFSYRCPRIFSEDYPDVKAYQQVLNVIKILFRYLGIGNNYIC